MSKRASMSEDLRKARGLTAKFPPVESIKLHRRQCSRLLEKVMETLDLAEEEVRSCRCPAQYSKLFHELYRKILTVKTFQDECCYKRESDFILAAIKVTAHKERFIKYYVELDWCVFLIERVRDAKGESVVSEKLLGFDWKGKARLLVEDTRSIVERDFSDFKDLLRKHVHKPGDHQKICATLLRRFREETDPVVDDDALEVPPFEKKGERIGKGGFAKVYNFKWKKTTFALKIPLLDSGNLDTEVAILEKCCHPNIVNLILFHRNSNGKQFLMMEKLSMNLLEYLESVVKVSSVPSLETVDMILQVCEGMEYLSDIHRVSHRDMKPENILVKLVGGQDDPVLELQVADFGLARVRAAIGKSSNQTPNVGTTRYLAPELALDPGADKIRGQSLKADIFSFAVTCSCILTGREPYGETIRTGGLEGVRKFVKRGGRPSLPDDCPAELASLLKECWHPEPSKRPASFFAICEELRKLKAMLLTSGVHDGDQSGPSSPEKRITFQPGVRALRILVLGNAKLVEATCMSICGEFGQVVDDHPLFKESFSVSPPMCLYRVAARSKADVIDYTDIMSFVKARNKRFHQVNLRAAWNEDLYFAPEDSTPFPNSSSRLHIVWYVCEKLDDLPNAMQWEDIAKELNGVPVQFLVTGTELYETKPRWKQRFFDYSQSVEDLIVKVDLKDAEAKNMLWRTCWEVKTKAEIKNAATIIGFIREQLGSSGIVIPVGIAARRTKEFSVDRSKEFVLNFLCSYWDVPFSFVKVLPSMRNRQEAIKFVPFCLQDAATILYREREHIHGLVPADATAEFVLREAQACADAYFTKLDLDACDKMKPGDILAFLEAVFENRGVPLVDRSWSLSKFLGRLLSKGNLPR